MLPGSLSVKAATAIFNRGYEVARLWTTEFLPEEGGVVGRFDAFRTYGLADRLAIVKWSFADQDLDVRVEALPQEGTKRPALLVHMTDETYAHYCYGHDYQAKKISELAPRFGYEPEKPAFWGDAAGSFYVSCKALEAKEETLSAARGAALAREVLLETVQAEVAALSSQNLVEIDKVTLGKDDYLLLVSKRDPDCEILGQVNAACRTMHDAAVQLREMNLLEAPSAQKIKAACAATLG